MWYRICKLHIDQIEILCLYYLYLFYKCIEKSHYHIDSENKLGKVAFRTVLAMSTKLYLDSRLWGGGGRGVGNVWYKADCLIQSIVDC